MRVVLNPKRCKEYSLARIVIKLRGDIVFEDPQSRIREYCEIEIHHGYDDKARVRILSLGFLPSLSFLNKKNLTLLRSSEVVVTSS